MALLHHSSLDLPLIHRSEIHSFHRKSLTMDQFCHYGTYHNAHVHGTFEAYHCKCLNGRLDIGTWLYQAEIESYAYWAEFSLKNNFLSRFYQFVSNINRWNSIFSMNCITISSRIKFIQNISNINQMFNFFTWYITTLESSYIYTLQIKSVI